MSLKRFSRNGSQSSRSDVYIAVMGVTGAGKSTFIKKCCNQDIPIGHTLQSCTSEVDVYTWQFNEATTVHLVDTPGFDDTGRSDTDVLKEIAAWLTQSYKEKIQLSGIIYLHRISDVRMQGSQMRNLHMFQKLCGKNALQNVVLATTMWDRIPQHEGEARERELTSTKEFWGDMVKRGSKVLRHSGDRDSALQLIQLLVKANNPLTLELQQQMVDEKKSLDNTDAGREVQAELIKERKRLEKKFAEALEAKEEALKAQDEELARAMAEQEAHYNSKIARLEESSAELKTSMEKLLKEKSAQLERKMERQQAKHERELRRMEQENQQAKVELEREREVLREREREREAERAARKRLEREIEREREEERKRREARKEREKEEERRRLVLSKQMQQLQVSDKQPAIKPPPVAPPRVDDSSRYSLAIHGNSFFFKGPKTTVGTWQPADGTVKHMNNSTLQVLALGLEDNWMTINTNNAPEWSSNTIAATYPDFVTAWNDNCKKFGTIQNIVLGTNQNFWIQGTSWIYWWLNSDIRDHVDIDNNYRKVTACALGMSGAYIFQLSNGANFWNLKGNYGALDKCLRANKSKIRVAALSLTDHYYIVVWEDGTVRLSTQDAYKKCWKEWVTAHWGTKWD